MNKGVRKERERLGTNELIGKVGRFFRKYLENSLNDSLIVPNVCVFWFPSYLARIYILSIPYTDLSLSSNLHLYRFLIMLKVT